MAEIVNSLFGLDRLGIEQQIRQEEDAFARSLAQGRVRPSSSYAGALLGQRLGTAIAKGLFGVEDPRLAKASKLEAAMQRVNASLTEEDRANPANVYFKLSQELAQDPDLQREALMVQEKAQQSGLEFRLKQSQIDENLAKAKQANRQKLSPFAQLQADYADAVASGKTEVAAELKRKIDIESSRAPATPENQAEATVLAKFIKDFGQEEGSKKFLEWQTEQKAKVSAAGKPVEYGGAKPADISTFENSVRNSLTPIKNVLSNVQSAKVNLQQVFAGNAQAVPLLDSSIMSLSKDNTISKADIERISRTGGFSQRVVDSFNRFLSGKPSDVNLQDKKQLLDALEVVYGEKYNKEQDRLRKSWSGSVLSQQQIDATLGSPYRLPGSSVGTPGQKKKTSSGVEYTIEAN